MTLPSAPGAPLARGIERLLFVAGGLCLGLALLGWGEAAVFQWLLESRLERALGEGAGAPAPSPSSAPATGSQTVAETAAAEGVDRGAAPAPSGDERLQPPPEPPPDAPIGRLVAPRLRLSAVVAEGISSRTLRRAVGHIPGTAMPWEDGNVGLAAHRDTFFWRLKDVKIGDTLRLVTPRGRFEYVVRTLHVVSPERADLLDPGETPRLTLVTCYPFSVVGPAPSRFVVTAERVEALGPASREPPALWTRYQQAPASY